MLLQHGEQHTQGRYFIHAYTTKTQTQSNTNAPTTIPIVYSGGKSLSVSVAVESESGVISKREAYVVLLEFALLSTKLPSVTLNGMTGTGVLLLEIGVSELARH